MSDGAWFPWAVAVLEGCCCLEYLSKGDTLMAVLWGGYFVAAVALAMVR